MKDIENELKLAKKFAEELIETSNAIIVAVDAKGIVSIFNNAAEYITGYKKEEVVGKSWFDFIAPIDKIPQVWKEFNRQLADRTRSKTFENPIFTKSGEQRHILWQSNNLYENNKAIGLVSFGIDITERKKIEKELIEAKERAEKADKLKTAFLANISHEIRTPLNGLIGFSNLLANNNLSKVEKNKYIRIINNSGNQLLNIINDVLDISKIETGQVEIFNTEVCINDLIRDISDNKPVSSSVNLFTHFFLNDEQCKILVDEVKLKQVLTNLLSNAIKFTHEGNIHLGYELKEDFILFYVKDSGIGIEKDKIDIIFDRFRQADNNLSKKYGGTGLGLSICKSHVEMMGGEIWVESELDQGSTFYFTIPYKCVTIPPIITDHDSLVLVVEDNDDVFLFLDIILNRKNIPIIHAENAKQALERFKTYKDKIKLVLMDMKLPDRMGYEIVPEILNIKQVPIVAQTAYSFSSERQKAIKSGCVDYLTKPIKEENISRILDKYYFK